MATRNGRGLRAFTLAQRRRRGVSSPGSARLPLAPSEPHRRYAPHGPAGRRPCPTAGLAAGAWRPLQGPGPGPSSAARDRPQARRPLPRPARPFPGPRRQGRLPGAPPDRPEGARPPPPSRRPPVRVVVVAAGGVDPTPPAAPCGPGPRQSGAAGRMRGPGSEAGLPPCLAAQEGGAGRSGARSIRVSRLADFAVSPPGRPGRGGGPAVRTLTPNRPPHPQSLHGAGDRRPAAGLRAAAPASPLGGSPGPGRHRAAVAGGKCRPRGAARGTR